MAYCKIVGHSETDFKHRKSVYFDSNRNRKPYKFVPQSDGRYRYKPASIWSKLLQLLVVVLLISCIIWQVKFSIDSNYFASDSKPKINNTIYRVKINHYNFEGYKFLASGVLDKAQESFMQSLRLDNYDYMASIGLTETLFLFCMEYDSNCGLARDYIGMTMQLSTIDEEKLNEWEEKLNEWEEKLIQK